MQKTIEYTRKCVVTEGGVDRYEVAGVAGQQRSKPIVALNLQRKTQRR